MKGNIHGKSEGYESWLQWAGLAVVQWTNIPWESIKSKASSVSGSEKAVVAAGTSYRGVWKVLNADDFTRDYTRHQGPIFCVINEDDTMLWTDNFKFYFEFQNSIVTQTETYGLVAQRDGVTLCLIQEKTDGLHFDCADKRHRLTDACRLG